MVSRRSSCRYYAGAVNLIRPYLNGTLTVSFAVPELNGFDIALVVGDDALRSALSMLLAVSGQRVTEFRTITEYLCSSMAVHHCLVIDCQLPGLSRRQLCEQMLKLDRTVPIVVVTAYAEEFDAARDLRGNMYVVHKPFASKQLVETVINAARAVSDPEHVEGSLSPARP